MAKVVRVLDHLDPPPPPPAPEPEPEPILPSELLDGNASSKPKAYHHWFLHDGTEDISDPQLRIQIDGFVDGEQLVPFYPTNFITGTVEMELNHPEPVTGLVVSLYGRGRTRVPRHQDRILMFTHTKGRDNESVRRLSKVRSSGEQILVDQWLNLVGDFMHNKEVVLMRALKIFPFKFQVPVNSPTTYRGGHGNIIYYIEAVIKRRIVKGVAMLPEIFSRTQVMIQGVVDLMDFPASGLPQVVEVSKRLAVERTVRCRKVKKVVRWMGLKFSTDQTGYESGGSMTFEMRAENFGTLPATFDVQLIQNTIYHVPGQAHASEYIVGKWHYGTIPVDSVNVWADDIVIPYDLPPTNFGGCKIIEMDYQIEITMMHGPKALVVKLPLLIGTIGLEHFTPRSSDESIIEHVSAGSSDSSNSSSTTSSYIDSDSDSDEEVYQRKKGIWKARKEEERAKRKALKKPFETESGVMKWRYRYKKVPQRKSKGQKRPVPPPESEDPDPPNDPDLPKVPEPPPPPPKS